MILMLLTACGRPSDPATGGAESALFDAVQGESVSESLDEFDNRGKWIDHYAKYAASCVTKVDELHGTKALFHGCYDWHSSVHAHWAVLRADLTGGGDSGAAAKAIDARLSTDALTRVRQDLEADADFEMPYGRAWFLRLASEHEAWAGARGVQDTQRLRELGQYVAKTMMDRYATTAPDPRSSDYDNDSWAVAQLYAWFTHVGDATQAAKVRKWVRDRFVTNPVTWAESNDTDTSAFFSRYWAFIYALTTTLEPQEALTAIKPASIPEAALTPRPDEGEGYDSVHNIGINWSRAWSMRAVARLQIAAAGETDDLSKKLVRAYHLHVQEGRKRHEKYRGRYRDYDHWVPQFGIYAITD